MNIKDGDYFSYSWKIVKGQQSDSYWCRDRRCVARENLEGKIVLIDTHNYWPFKDREIEKEIFTYEGLDREYSRYVQEDVCDLEFICNLNDYEFVQEYEKDDYDNIVFVGFQCTRKWAKPKGASKSKTAILTKLLGQLDAARSDKRSAEYSIERISKDIEELNLSENKY